MADAPGSLRRLLFRLPLRCERLGRLLSRLLGVEWIVLETVGRRSGRIHPVVLDVVGRDPARDIYYVQPAYGRRAAWVRNVAARPELEARIGARRVRVRVRDASGAEGAEVVLRFLRAHPWYGRVIVWLVGYIDRIDRPDDELRAALSATPVFAVEHPGPGCVERVGPPPRRERSGTLRVAAARRPHCPAAATARRKDCSDGTGRL